MRKSVQAFAALRTGQDLQRPAGNYGAFYSSLFQSRQNSKRNSLKRFAVIREGQERARPKGNFGAFYFRRSHGWQTTK